MKQPKKHDTPRRAPSAPRDERWSRTRGPARSLFRALGLALAALLWPRGVLAEEGVEFAVEYSAPPECPAIDDFVRAVTLRVRAARAVPSFTAKTRFHVGIVPVPGGVDGTLTVFVEGTGASTREVPGTACDDVVASMAVIAALVLEGHDEPQTGGAAGSGPSTEVPTAAEAPSAAPPATPAAEAQGSVAMPIPPKAPGEQSATLSVAPDVRQVELPSSFGSRSPPKFDVRAVAGGALEGAVRSSGSFGVWGGAELVFQRPWPSAVRLSVLYVPPVVQANPNGNAEFRLIAGAVAMCPIRFGSGSFVVSPCATSELGELRGDGLSVLNHRERSMFWLSGILSVRPELRLASFAWLSADAGVRALAHNDRFILDPDVVIHDVPLFSYHFGLGLSVRLY